VGEGKDRLLSQRARRSSERASAIHRRQSSRPCDLVTSDASADCAAGKHCRIGIFCIGRIFHGTISLASSILKEDGYGRSNKTSVEWIPQWHGLDTSFPWPLHSRSFGNPSCHVDVSCAATLWRLQLRTISIQKCQSQDAVIRLIVLIHSSTHLRPHIPTGRAVFFQAIPTHSIFPVIALLG
jgi:hypothetical protein